MHIIVSTRPGPARHRQPFALVMVTVLTVAGAGHGVAASCRSPEPGCAAPEQSAAPAAEVMPADSPATARIQGLHELRFNPLSGRFTVDVEGAKVTSDARQVRIFINDRRLPDAAFALSRSAITVYYVFEPGLNEVLILAPDSDGHRIRADGLYWAGRRSLVVDVTNTDQNPVDGALVTVRLGQAGTVRATEATAGGTARFDNLPAQNIVVDASAAGYNGASMAPPAGAGSILLVLTPVTNVASQGR